MRNGRTWLVAIFTAAVLIFSEASSVALAKPAAAKNHWRHHDGHWSYWHSGDKRWYYTDGANWYYNDNDDAWKVYRFDKNFGRKGFKRGKYRAPAAGVKVEAPRHRVYRRR
jgi:hypothetical protein